MKTKISLVLTALLMLFCISASAQGSETPIKGDVNGDGVVNAADIVVITNIIMESEQGGETEPEIIDNGDGPYYWYVGNTQPTDNTDPKTTKGWTSLESNPNQINVFAQEPNWNEVQWYLAAPAEWGFVTNVNGTQVRGWDISTVTIDGTEYTVWTAQGLQDSVNVTLSNINGSSDPEPTGEEPTGEPEIIDNGDGPYYWYVGNEEPTGDTDPKTTKGWTSLESKPNQIVVFAEEPNWNDVQWYLAAPAEWDFDTTFNGVHVGGWIYSTIQINGMEYSVWKGGALTDSVNVTLSN